MVVGAALLLLAGGVSLAYVLGEPATETASRAPSPTSSLGPTPRVDEVHAATGTIKMPDVLSENSEHVFRAEVLDQTNGIPISNLRDEYDSGATEDFDDLPDIAWEQGEATHVEVLVKEVWKGPWSAGDTKYVYVFESCPECQHHETYPSLSLGDQAAFFVGDDVNFPNDLSAIDEGDGVWKYEVRVSEENLYVQESKKRKMLESDFEAGV